MSSTSFQSSDIPPSWARQKGATGLTYEDPDLIGTAVGSTAWRDHNVASGSLIPVVDPEEHFFVRVGGWDYDFVASTMPEKKIQAYHDHHLNSRVGMFSPYLGTRSGGEFLDQKR